MRSNQPWIFSATVDLAFIIAPAIAVSLIAILFNQQIQTLEEPLWLWLVLVVAIDAGHVYSTIFRTYFNRDELRKRQILYVTIPLFSWIVGCLIYTMSALMFWRVAAYLAVFHFVRQQYGFMMIYARKEYNFSTYYKLIDKLAIYLSTLYPLIYWHCHNRSFNWFIEGDFIIAEIPSYINNIAATLYVLILLIYIIKEIITGYKLRHFNIAKNLLLFSTALSWFVGIIAFDNDLIFTLTNVISHGVAYYALIWIFCHNQNKFKDYRNDYIKPLLAKLFEPRAIILYVAIIVMIAFLEEALWDKMLWHQNFRLFSFLPFDFNLSKQTLSWLVPLLALPQITHYILDAFIWRMNTKNTNWKEILFYQQR